MQIYGLEKELLGIDLKQWIDVALENISFFEREMGLGGGVQKRGGSSGWTFRRKIKLLLV